jgi:hypothetical protein
LPTSLSISNLLGTDLELGRILVLPCANKKTRPIPWKEKEIQSSQDRKLVDSFVLHRLVLTRPLVNLSHVMNCGLRNRYQAKREAPPTKERQIPRGLPIRDLSDGRSRARPDSKWFKVLHSSFHATACYTREPSRVYSLTPGERHVQFRSFSSPIRAISSIQLEARMMYFLSLFLLLRNWGNHKQHSRLNSREARRIDFHQPSDLTTSRLADYCSVSG